jgi:hypothetical protein
MLRYSDGLYKGDAADAARLSLVDLLLRNTAVIFLYGWMTFQLMGDNPSRQSMVSYVS